MSFREDDTAEREATQKGHIASTQKLTSPMPIRPSEDRTIRCSLIILSTNGIAPINPSVSTSNLWRPGGVSLDVARAYLMADIPTEHPQALEVCRSLMGPEFGVNSNLQPLAILLLLGEREEARQLSLELLEPLRKSVMRKRSMAIEVVSGRRTADAVMSELEGSKRDQALTQYVIAVDLLSQGRREEARSQFQRAATVAGGITNAANWSRAFYERLSADPTWPPWIPMREEDGATNKPEPATANGSGE